MNLITYLFLYIYIGGIRKCFGASARNDKPRHADSTGYISVGVEEGCDPRFEDLELEISGGDGKKTLKDAVHDIILWPKKYIIIPEIEASIPARDPPHPPPSSSPAPSPQPGSSSRHARSPSPQPLNSGGASDDDDIPPQSPPNQPPAAKEAPKRSRAQASKARQPPP